MNLLNQILYYMNMVGACAILASGIVCGALFYFVKVKKVVARTENINTDSFERKDSVSYVPIKDILYQGSLDSDGIIAISDTVFVGGLSVRGFDYPSASVEERIDAQVNSTMFFNVVEEPTSFRQSVQSIDLSSNIEEYDEIIKRTATELMGLDADYTATIAAAEEAAEEDPDSFPIYEERLNELRRKISAKNHVLEECKACVSYMQSMSKDSSHTSSGGQRSSQILFSYTFNPDMYSQELTKEEIYLKAMEGLQAKARSYMDALAFCHFRATRLSCRDLIGLMRRHIFPLSGEDGRLEELLDSSYTSLFVSCDSLVEAQKEKLGQEEYERRLRSYEEELQEMLERQNAQMLEESYELYDASLAKAREEMKARKDYEEGDI